MDPLRLLDLVCDCEVLRRERDQAREERDRLRVEVATLERALVDLALEDEEGRTWN
jgi:hypothetical protein